MVEGHYFDKLLNRHSSAMVQHIAMLLFLMHL